MFSNFVYRFPLGPSCATSLLIKIWKPIWPPDGHLEFWTSKFVTAISQQLLDELFSNFVYRFPLGPSCATSLFIQIWKPIWPPGGHLEFLTSKFVTAIFQQLLDELFSNFVHRFPLGPCCATSLLIQIWKPIWPPDGHLEFWTSKFVTVTFHQLLYGLFSNFIYRFPLLTLLVKLSHCDLYSNGPVIFLYNSKVFWRIFMKLGNINIKWDGLQPLAKIRSLWPIFHGPVIFLYNSKVFWRIFMKPGNINIKWDGLQLLAKIRSPWPIFHGPVIFLYNSKVFWRIFMKLGNINIKWDGLQPLAKIRSPWPIFHGPVIFLYNSKVFWRIFMKPGNINIKWDGLQLLAKIRSLYLYFMVQWFSFITPWLFDIYLWNLRISI